MLAAALVIVAAVVAGVVATRGGSTSSSAAHSATTAASASSPSRPGAASTSAPTPASPVTTSRSTTSHASTSGAAGAAGSAGRPPATPKGGIPAIEAGVLPWTLGQAVSREIVLPGPGTDLTVAGGLDASQQSLANVVSLDTTSGNESTLSSLPAAVHDASGALIGGAGYAFGGGSPDTVATVQRFPAPLPTPAARGARGATSTPVSPAAVGQLPQPRSDSASVTVGSTTYVVGGYDGTNPDAAVLATTDGQHFSVVARLPVPVRYPAVAALGGRIYAFGGQATGGAQNGRAVTAIQEIDPGAKTANVVAHLAQPLAGASAVVLGGHLYVAGGVSDAGSSSSATPGAALSAIWAFDPVKNKVLNAGNLPVATSYAGTAVLGGRAWLVGGESSGTPMSSVEMMVPNTKFGTAGLTGAGSPYFGGRLLVADRGNNRLLLLNTQNQTVWTYPSVYAAPPPGGFYFPDDAFFAKNGTEIISNQEQNETIVIISFPSGKVLWSYGHARQPGGLPGYLYEPDDAYLLKNGQVTVADADNCRVLFINQNGTIANQIGQTGGCGHQPGTYLSSPNGDTPLADGNILVSEIQGSYIDEYTPQGKMVWETQLPSVGYVSDPQQIGPDLYLVSDYSQPGAIVEFTREGKVVYTYRPTSGLGALNQNSLTELLPSGVFMTNDDYRDRMVAIDPATQSIVWQYGVADQPGTAPGYLNTPDGFDVLMPGGVTPTHEPTA